MQYSNMDEIMSYIEGDIMVATSIYPSTSHITLVMSEHHKMVNVVV